VAFLVATALYLLGGYRMSLAELGYEPAPALVSVRPWFWAAQFHMFNEPRPTVARLGAEMERGAGWEAVDLEVYYPTLRQEGPGYARRRFTSDPGRVALLAADLCRQAGGEAVHLWVERVPKVGGAPSVREELGRYSCAAGPS
jgi:hypothetical protein